MEYRNAKYNRNGGIDCEINHPRYGWIPFTARPDDPDRAAKAVWTSIDKSAVGPYVAPTITVTVQNVKDEAYRRIVAIIPEWKQRNLIAQATQLLHKGEANWTAEDTAAWNAGNAIWQQVEAIRAASGVIEAMTPIPGDYNNDSYWPAK